MATEDGHYEIEVFGKGGILLFTSTFVPETSMEYHAPPLFGLLPVAGFKITYVPPERETS